LCHQVDHADLSNCSCRLQLDLEHATRQFFSFVRKIRDWLAATCTSFGIIKVPQSAGWRNLGNPSFFIGVLRSKIYQVEHKLASVDRSITCHNNDSIPGRDFLIVIEHMVYTLVCNSRIIVCTAFLLCLHFFYQPRYR